MITHQQSPLVRLKMPNRDLQEISQTLIATFVKRKGHYARDCPKLKKKKEKEQQNGESSKPKRSFPPCGHCGLTNHSTEDAIKTRTIEIRENQQ